MRAGIASTLGISVDNSLTPASAGTGKGGTADVPRSCPNLKPANQPASLPAFLSVYLPACLPAYPSVHMSFCPCPPVFPTTSPCLTCKEPTCLSACSPIKHASLAVYVHYLPSFISPSSLPPSSCSLFIPLPFIRCSTLPFPLFTHLAVSLYYSYLQHFLFLNKVSCISPFSLTLSSSFPPCPFPPFLVLLPLLPFTLYTHNHRMDVLSSSFPSLPLSYNFLHL